MMKRKIGILIGRIAAVAAVVFLAGTTAASYAPLKGGSFRQQLAVASDAPQLLAEDGLLGERLRKLEEAKIDKIAGELEKNPKLLDDPNYLAQHPRLATYLEKHPEAKQKIEKDPRGFFQHIKDEKGQGMGG